MFTFFSQIVTYITTYLRTLAGAFLQAVSNWIKAVLNIVRGWIIEWMPTSVSDWINNADWDPYLQVLADVQWFLPIAQVLGILATTYTLVGLVRLGRWLFACLPTLGG